MPQRPFDGRPMTSPVIHVVRPAVAAMLAVVLQGCGGEAGVGTPGSVVGPSSVLPPSPVAGAASAPTPERIDAARRYHEASGGQALAMLLDGALVHESYANGGGPFTPQLLASGTKGFTGMFGIMAAEDGMFRLDEPVARAVPEWRTDPRRSRILWRHLLTMTSGLEDVKKQDVWEDFLLARAVAEPGAVFDYGSAPNVFGAAL